MQIGLYIWYVFLLALTFVLAVSAVPVKEENELQNDSNCKALCQHCGCIGFYCGEECICECSGDNKEDMECLATMQSNCKKLNIPFEVLIQGPSENRFVRSALLLEQGIKQCSAQEGRMKRSTAVIYKPGLKGNAPLANALINIRNAKLAEQNAIKNSTYAVAGKAAKNEIKSHKRRGIASFMDENNFLVAPAPRRHLAQHRDLMPSASENVASGIPLPGANLQIGNAVAKMREALLNLNAKTEQLLSAAQTAPTLQLAPNFLNFLPSVTPFPQPREPELPIPEPSNMIGVPEDRPLLRSILSNFPRLNNLLNN